MKNNDQHIKEFIDDFVIEGYDLPDGWGKLEKRIQSRKRVFHLWRYTAAACLLLMLLTYFLFKEPAKMQSPVAFRPKTNTKIEGDSNTISKVIIVNPGSLKNIVTKKPVNILQVLKSSQKSMEEPAIETTELRNDNKTPALAVMETVKKEEAATKNPLLENEKKAPAQKAITVITEDEFASIVNPDGVEQVKQNRFTKYMASRARQLEYTGEKLSSQTTLVKF